MSLKNWLKSQTIDRPGNNRRRNTGVTRNFSLHSIHHLQSRQLLSATNPLPLESLDGSNGFRIDGIDPVDRSGYSVSSAGDVNGDGFDDIIIGALISNTQDFGNAGESYVVFGKSGGFTNALPLIWLNGRNGFRIDGIKAGDDAGFSVSGAGDVNGDGFDDLIIGAPSADSGGNNQTGQSYVVFGKSTSFNSALDLSTLDGSNGFRIDGIDRPDSSGVSVSSPGDVDGDGFDDLIIGAHFASPGGKSSGGESYVVFGKSGGFMSAVDLSTLNGKDGFRIDGIDRGDRLGRSVSSAGDINGDGLDDLIIGGPSANSGGVDDAGASYVVFGKFAGFTSALDLGTLDGSNGFRIDGIDTNDYSGGSVSSAGDVNGDGFDDLIIGAVSPNGSGNHGAGVSYVVFGQSAGFTSAVDLSMLDGNDGFHIVGIDASDQPGVYVGSAGDVNGDGFDDLIIGADRVEAGGDMEAGESFVVFGKSAGFTSVVELSIMNGINGFRIVGTDADDLSGGSVSSAGDVNGDGFDDIIIGAHGADPNGNTLAGESYVVFGGNFTGGTETQVGNRSTNTLTAIQGASAIDILTGGAVMTP